MAENNLGNVLVVGAGIGGIKAAIELAERGYDVILTESSPAIGGILSQLDYQFPNNHCGLCRMLPVWERDLASEYCMRKGLFHENIQIMPMTDLEAVSGEVGHFEVTLKHRPRGVDTKRCIGCDRCVEVCPVEVADGFNEGLSRRKAVYQAIPHNVPFSYAIDFEACNACGECVKVCPTEAIDLSREDVEEVLEVGSIILATGCGVYDPSPMEVYNYKEWPEVITSLELERMLSGTGPMDGKLSRPSDQAPIKGLAWVQCVGSRNKRLDQDYCSSICCMFALKEAMLMKERYPDADAVVFYMDMRAYGKDGYRYQMEAQELGVELIRGRVSALERGPDNRIYVKYYSDSDGGIRTRAFELAVLATGQTSTPELRRLAGITGVTLNDYGFAQGSGISQEAGSRPGVTCCGSSTGLKEIAETVIQAQAAAMSAAGDLGAPPDSENSKVSPPEKDLYREDPGIVFLKCNCFGHQDEDLPWEEIKAGVSKYPNLVEVIEEDRICTPEGFERARSLLEGKDFNRLIVGACRPYLYDKKLRKLALGQGIPEEFVEIVDLRGVGLSPNNPEEKEEVARSLISAAFSKLRNQDVAFSEPTPIDKDLLVVGGGLAGMEAAMSAASQGINVWLVEKSGDLGGEVLRRRYTIEGHDPRAYIEELKQKVGKEERINVLFNAEITGLNGEVGRFRAAVRQKDEEQIIPCGAVIMATGGREAGTSEYAYGQDPRIMVQGDLEIKLADETLKPEDFARVVMIQCVGSRNDDRPYCSRICCTAALKNAARIKENYPESQIFVLYRDMMSYGFLESYYRRARKMGIQFITYSLETKPEVKSDGNDLEVLFHEPILNRTVEIKPSLLVLSTGVEPSDHKGLADRLGVEINGDGFFQEMDSKWRPVDLSRPGVFSCGLAKAPCSMTEALMQSRAAAMRAVNILAKSKFRPVRAVSDIKQSLCSVCETCVEACPFDARYKEGDRIKVIASACQGCGICVAACPNGAAWLPSSTERQTMGILEGLLENIKWA